MKLVDRFDRMKLPQIVLFKGKKYIGEAVFINGYNGYSSTKEDGILAALINNSACDKKGRPNSLTDSKGRTLRAKERRSIHCIFQYTHMIGSGAAL